MKSSRKSSAKPTVEESIKRGRYREAVLKAFREVPAERLRIEVGRIPSRADLNALESEDNLSGVDPETFVKRRELALKKGQQTAAQRRREKAKPAEEWFALAHARNPKFGAKKLAHAARELFLRKKPTASAKELSLFTLHRAKAFLARQKNA